MSNNNKNENKVYKSLWKKFSDAAGGTLPQRLKLAIPLMLIWIVGGSIWALLDYWLSS